MTQRNFYTAIGRLERKNNNCGDSCPVIILGGKEHMVNIQEMIIWSILNWRIVKREEIGILYEMTVCNSGYAAAQSWSDCVDRLLIRGLVISGTGGSDYDALYDLLAALYIIPANGTLWLRLLSFLKLTLYNHLPLTKTKQLFARDRRTASEDQVMQLSQQALLSTAEIIKCIEKDIRCLPTETSIISCLYNDQDTTSDNIAAMVKNSPNSRSVIQAVANLYLRQQIIFERI